ncbi:MAG TPA: right-handed parallel beta-helix repeat-containing protein [Thermoanaerobaculia bacterium]|nr:right-handed parallel beta-helix repeat-containing protein [Thermoanaerobaculia bacterium]
MRRIALPLAAFVLCGSLSSSAYAQATRTWVSGVGNDADPCSRTAPCKTFAGAISKTATGGEINVLDPGGFGGVTITKSLTISSEGFEAGVLVSGTNAIIINATTTSTVVLRGLDIEGLGTGLDGIKVLGGLAALHVEKCTIEGFRGTNGSGIEIATTTAGTTQVFIKDTIVRHNGAGTGGGILINPTGAGVIVKASLDNVRLEQNSFGLKVNGATTASVSNSVAAGNGAAGFSAGSSPAVLNIEDSVAANNGTGVVCAAGTSVRLGTMSITGNPTPVTPGACSSFGNNHIDQSVALLPISPANQ